MNQIIIEEITLQECYNNYNISEIYNGKSGGAYNGARFLANSIKSDGHEKIYSSINEGIKFYPSDNAKRGIFTFSTDVNAEQKSQIVLVNSLRNKFETIKNRLTATKKINKIASKNEIVGWTIGHYFDGHYTSPKNNKHFGEKSLSVEIIGVDLETLIKIVLIICHSFSQESVLLKDFSSERVMFIDKKTSKVSGVS